MSEDISERAISELVKALGRRGFAISADAVDGLRRQFETTEAKEEIRRALRAGEKSPSDVTKGMETLAMGVAEILQAKKTRTAQMGDIELAIRARRCRTWPFCKPKED